MNSEDKASPIDRRAIADQVIVSAGNILVAAGFGREEIGFFFRQAADLLAPAFPRSEAPPNPEQAGLAQISSAFARFRPVSQLQQLIAQARPLLPIPPEGPQLKECFDLAMQMAPLVAEAQKGLRTMAEEAALPLYASRDEWLANAGTPNLADAPPAVCLEDFETAYRGAFETIGAVADELLRRQDSEAFTFLLNHLAQNGVVIDRALHASLERGIQQIHAAIK